MLLILTPYNSSSNDQEIPRLAKTAEVLGWEVCFANCGWRLPEDLIGEKGVVYGELYFCEVVAEQMNWRLRSNSLDWLAKLPEEYVKREICFTTLAQARFLTAKKFIKPADDKCFPAKVYNSGDDLPKHSIMDNTPVLISDKVTFTYEYRCFIKDREVVSISCYLYHNAFNNAKEFNKSFNWYFGVDAVIAFVNKMLKDPKIECVPGTVIDVGKLKNGDLMVIDTNPAYVSNLYGCELAGSLDAIKSSCEMEQR